MTDQNTQLFQQNIPATTQLNMSQPTLVQGVAADPDFSKTVNPAEVYDQMDNLTLSEDEMILNGAFTQVQQEMAQNTIQIAKDMQDLMKQEDSERPAE